MMIELDLSAPWEAPEEPLIGRGLRPHWLIVGLLLVGALVLTGGARASASYDPLYTVDGDASVTLVGGGRLFVIHDGILPVGSSRVVSRLVAHRLDNGAPLWSADIGATGRDLLYADERTVLTIEVDSSVTQPAIAARDAATGRLLWQRRGIGADQVVDGVLVGEAAEATDDRHHLVYGIALDTGETTWTIDSGVGTAFAYLYHELDYADGLYGLAQLDQDRSVRVRDPRTGAVVSTV